MRENETSFQSQDILNREKVFPLVLLLIENECFSSLNPVQVDSEDNRIFRDSFEGTEKILHHPPADPEIVC